MTQNFLLDKIEVVVFGPESFRIQMSRYIVTQDGIFIAFTTIVSNFGVIFVFDLFLETCPLTHIKNSSQGFPFFHLQNRIKNSSARI